MSEPTIAKLFDLTGKTALITGGSGYLGRSLSRAMAEAGASVIIASRDLERAKQVVHELPTPGGSVHCAVVIDQLDEDSIQSGFDAALSIAGKVDLLVNNGQQGHALDLTNVTAEAFSSDLKNVTGYFLLARCLRDHLVSRETHGAIVMIGSMYGVVGSYPEAYEGICTASPVQYHALKGGIIHMTRHLAVYWAKDNLRVNCLSPGPFPSEKAPRDMVEHSKPKAPWAAWANPMNSKGHCYYSSAMRAATSPGKTS